MFKMYNKIIKERHQTTLKEHSIMSNVSSKRNLHYTSVPTSGR